MDSSNIERISKALANETRLLAAPVNTSAFERSRPCID